MSAEWKFEICNVFFWLLPYSMMRRTNRGFENVHALCSNYIYSNTLDIIYIYIYNLSLFTLTKPSVTVIKNGIS